MTWRTAEFRAYFLNGVGNENSASSYAVNLRKLDDFTGGLDEKIAELGYGPIIEWAKQQTDGPLAGPYASNVRSALNRYVKFLLDASDPEAVEAPSPEVAPDNEAIEATLFRYEKELQVAVRRQIATLGANLVIADGGTERAVTTGRIDVLAQEPEGRYVVIELKAGTCPAGALEQVLGYAEDIRAETGNDCRSVLIAAEFPERIRAASKWIPSLSLVTYKLALAFEPQP